MLVSLALQALLVALGQVVQVAQLAQEEKPDHQALTGKLEPLVGLDHLVQVDLADQLVTKAYRGLLVPQETLVSHSLL